MSEDAAVAEDARAQVRTGMVQAINGAGAHVIYLDEIAGKVCDFGEAAGARRDMPAPEIMARADVIINVPRAKWKAAGAALVAAGLPLTRKAIRQGGESR